MEEDFTLNSNDCDGGRKSLRNLSKYEDAIRRTPDRKCKQIVRYSESMDYSLFYPNTFSEEKKGDGNKNNDNTINLKELKVELGSFTVNDEYKNERENVAPQTPKSTKKYSKLTRQSVKRKNFDDYYDSDESETIPSPNKKLDVKSDVCATPKTLKIRLKLIKNDEITPTIKTRYTIVQNDNSTPLMKARKQLHVSYSPKALPCREKEYDDVLNFLQGKLNDECSGCIYISGVPGTGKTATVTSVIKHLQENKNVPNFTFINVNGLKLTEPRQTYVEILKQFNGKTLTWEQAQSMLQDIFIKSKKSKPVILLIDELDILCTKRQEVIYNLLEWPSKAKTQLIIVMIANTMDLPERLLTSKVTSRLGLTRLTFQAYTFKQLQNIVIQRLSGTDSSFNVDSIRLVARKVASVSGDARRALDICRKATEIAEAENSSQLVTMKHVDLALNTMMTHPKIQAIKHCSKLEKLILQSIVGEVQRTGSEETTFADVYNMLFSLTAVDDFQMVSTRVSLLAVSRLSSCKLVLTDPKCNNIHQRIVLNVSPDDIYYALKDI